MVLITDREGMCIFWDSDVVYVNGKVFEQEPTQNGVWNMEVWYILYIFLEFIYHTCPYIVRRPSGRAR